MCIVKRGQSNLARVPTVFGGQEVAMKSYLQTYIEEYRRVFEAEVDGLYRQWKEERQEKEDAETRSEA